MKTILLLILSVFTLTANTQLTHKEFYDLLVKYQIKCPEVVLRQAICESGNKFNSYAATNKNNYLGVANGSKIFDNVDSCITFYKRQFNDRFTGTTNEEYYSFLNCMWYKSDGSCQRYAMSLTYTDYLKKIKPDI